MKSVMLSALAVCLLPTQSTARTVNYLNFQSARYEALTLPPRLEADFQDLRDVGTDFQQEPKIPLWLDISAPPLPLAIHNQRSCPAPRWKPLGLKPDAELRRARYFPLMANAACTHGIPVDLFDALILQESGYNPLAHSNKGASGLTQLMPETARSHGITNVWNIEQNLAGGARVLAAHLAEFGRYDLALAAYNAGPGRVRPHHAVPAIAETQNYVSSILSRLDRNAIQRETVALADRQNERRLVIAF